MFDHHDALRLERLPDKSLRVRPPRSGRRLSLCPPDPGGRPGAGQGGSSPGAGGGRRSRCPGARRGQRGRRPRPVGVRRVGRLRRRVRAAPAPAPPARGGPAVVADPPLRPADSLDGTGGRRTCRPPAGWSPRTGGGRCTGPRPTQGRLRQPGNRQGNAAVPEPLLMLGQPCTASELAIDLPTEMVEPLLDTVPAAFNAEARDVLLTGLALALGRWRAPPRRPVGGPGAGRRGGRRPLGLRPWG